jgi:hypothetical protein
VGSVLNEEARARGAGGGRLGVAAPDDDAARPRGRMRVPEPSALRTKASVLDQRTALERQIEETRRRKHDAKVEERRSAAEAEASARAERRQETLRYMEELKASGQYGRLRKVRRDLLREVQQEGQLARQRGEALRRLGAEGTRGWQFFQKEADAPRGGRRLAEAGRSATRSQISLAPGGGADDFFTRREMDAYQSNRRAAAWLG